MNRFDHIDWAPVAKLLFTAVGAMAGAALAIIGAGFGLKRLSRHYNSKKTKEKGES